MEEQFVRKPDSYLWLAILSTICCCLPFGIVAIVKASKVNDLFIMKQYEAAEFASNEAKKWSIIAVICGVVIYALYFMLYLIYGIALLSMI